jgi:hypothetical protein
MYPQVSISSVMARKKHVQNMAKPYIQAVEVHEYRGLLVAPTGSSMRMIWTIQSKVSIMAIVASPCWAIVAPGAHHMTPVSMYQRPY